MGILITGTVENEYTYGSGINAGVPFSYTGDFHEVFVYQSPINSCDMQRSPAFTVTVPYRERNGTSDVDRNITVRAVSVDWDRNRGFFGGGVDFGDDPVSNTNSGISLDVTSIRGTNNNAYDFKLKICRSDSPSLPIVARPDTYRLSQPPFTTLESGTRDATTPSLVCLNRVISEYDNTFSVVNGSDTNSIRIQYRFYAVVRRVAPCLTELVV